MKNEIFLKKLVEAEKFNIKIFSSCLFTKNLRRGKFFSDFKTFFTINSFAGGVKYLCTVKNSSLLNIWWFLPSSNSNWFWFFRFFRITFEGNSPKKENFVLIFYHLNLMKYFVCVFSYICWMKLIFFLSISLPLFVFSCTTNWRFFVG